MNYIVISYISYIIITVPLTIWVARTLYKNGRVFLIKSMNNDEQLADSVNHLLVVGFYLVNLGFVSLYLKIQEEVASISEIFESLSAKIGVVMLVLGCMHFFNIYLFSKIGKKSSTPLIPSPYTQGGGQPKY